jgi:hypothetical protein
MHSGRHLRAAPSCLSLEGGEGEGGKCVATAQYRERHQAADSTGAMDAS